MRNLLFIFSNKEIQVQYIHEQLATKFYIGENFLLNFMHEKFTFHFPVIRKFTIIVIQKYWVLVNTA